MGFWKRLIGFAVAIVNDEGFEYEAGGILVSCRQCSATRFVKSKAQLNTKERTILGLDFFDKSANTLRCKKCGCIYWFGKPLVNHLSTNRLD